MLRLCYLCLSGQHIVQQCPEVKTCPKCESKHHVLLYPNTESTGGIHNSTLVSESSAPVACLTSAVRQRNVMLGTALVHISDHSGAMHTVRALIDAGFQITALTKCCVNRLGLHVKRWTTSVTGLAGVQVPPAVIGQVKCLLTPATLILRGYRRLPGCWIK